MRKPLYSVVLFLFSFAAVYAQTSTVEKSRIYTWPLASTDSVVSGLEGIRCVAVGDLNNDGKNEIVVTNYADRGHVHVFALAGQDSFELVWTSPRMAVAGGTASPRNVIIADLDNDGLKEIVCEDAGNGISIYEWDGVTGSYNFGTTQSQLITSDNCAGFPSIITGTTYTEKMTADDVDGDGQQELVMSYRSSASVEQKYMIIKATGGWDTDNPGFSSFDMVYVAARPDLVTYGLGGGSAFSMMPANLDGTGYKEVVMQAYDHGATTVLRYDNGEWKLADTTNGKQNIFLYSTDGVSYFGGLVTDIDKDGRDEVYLPTSIGDSANAGKVSVIYYDSPATPNEIDSSNVFKIDFSNITRSSIWGYTYGDLDGNGKPNVYFTTAVLGKAILSAEFEGGDKTNPSNWKTSVLYYGDSTAHSMVIKDSAGVIDTTKVVNEVYFPSKVFCQGMDVDGDGNEDLVAGYQPWNYGSGTTDSVTVTTATWQSGTTYDSVTTKVVNPKRYGFVMLTKSTATGVQAKDLVFITPQDYKLHQNYPNPFNPSTTIQFELPLNKNVTVKIYDMLGKEVKTLVNNEQMAKGTHSLVWNGHNNFGGQVASGSYILRMTAGNVVKTMKMMLLK